MDWLQKAMQLFQLLPSLLQMITQVETTFKGIAGAGPVKKELITAPLVAVGTPAEVMNTISTVIDSMVAALNKTGVMVKQ